MSMKRDYDIDDLIGKIDFQSNSFQNINGFLLTNHEVDVLNKNHINYKKCKSLKEVIYEIEEVLLDMDIVDEELDLISSSISERDYYMNTNK